MTDYEYGAGSTRLLVADDKTMDGVTPLVLIQMAHLVDPSLYVHVKAEDAPALALAILEAAGLGVAGVDNLTSVLDGLRTYASEIEELRAEKEEREAEDAKVVEFHTAIGANLNRIERHHRDLYNAARKFFEEQS